MKILKRYNTYPALLIGPEAGNSVPSSFTGTTEDSPTDDPNVDNIDVVISPSATPEPSVAPEPIAVKSINWYIVKFDDKNPTVHYLAQLMRVKNRKKEVEVTCYLSTSYKQLKTASKKCFKKYLIAETIEVEQIVTGLTIMMSSCKGVKFFQPKSKVSCKIVFRIFVNYVTLRNSQCCISLYTNGHWSAIKTFQTSLTYYVEIF